MRLVDAHKALPIAHEALSEAHKLGVDYPLYSESLRTISALYLANGELERAQPYLMEDYKLLSKLGKDYYGLDFDLFHLAVIQEVNGNLSQAEKLLKQAFDASHSYEKDDPSTARILAHLSAVEFARGATAEGNQYLKLLREDLLSQKTHQILIEEVNGIKSDLYRFRGKIENNAPQLNVAYDKILTQLHAMTLQANSRARHQ